MRSSQRPIRVVVYCMAPRTRESPFTGWMSSSEEAAYFGDEQPISDDLQSIRGPHWCRWCWEEFRFPRTSWSRQTRAPSPHSRNRQGRNPHAAPLSIRHLGTTDKPHHPSHAGRYALPKPAWANPIQPPAQDTGGHKDRGLGVPIRPDLRHVACEVHQCNPRSGKPR